MLLQNLPQAFLFIILDYLALYLNRYDLLIVSEVNKSFNESLKILLRHKIDLMLAKNRFLNRYMEETKFYVLFFYSKLVSSLFLLGGNQDYRKCDKLNFCKGKFNKVCGLSLKRNDDFDAIFFSGLIFVMSGSDDSALGMIETYNIYTDTWNLFPPLNESIASMACCVQDKKLLVIGGCVTQSSQRSRKIYVLEEECVSTMDVTKLNSKQIEKINYWQISDAQLSIGRSHHACAAYKGNIWVVGGLVQGRITATNSCEVVSVSKNIVWEGPNMNINRFFPRLLVCEEGFFFF
jgi:hypothetical protein